MGSDGGQGDAAGGKASGGTGVGSGGSSDAVNCAVYII